MATLFAVIKYLKKKGMVDAAEKVQQLDDRLQEAESDPRLSDNPEVALKAVMKRHAITFEFGREFDFYSWAYIASKGFGSLASTTDQYSGVISYSDISEPSSMKI